MSEIQDDLGALTPYYADDIELLNPSDELTVLLNIFQHHFVTEGVLFNDIQICVEKKRANIKQFYAYPFTFVHVITQETTNGQREFDQKRAKRVHWIKPILVNCNDDRVFVFERNHDKTGTPQLYFWFKEYSYVVILRSLNDKKQLVTAFCVEGRKAKQFERWLIEKPINEKPHILCGVRNLRQCD